MKVLLVDDSEPFLSAMAQLLSEWPGVQTIGRARYGGEALHMIEALQPDVVLMDVSMPDMSGFDVLRRLRANPQRPRVIMVSLHDAPEYRRAAEILGAFGYVVKSTLATKLPPLLGALVPCVAPVRGDQTAGLPISATEVHDG